MNQQQHDLKCAKNFIEEAIKAGSKLNVKDTEDNRVYGKAMEYYLGEALKVMDKVNREIK